MSKDKAFIFFLLVLVNQKLVNTKKISICYLKITCIIYRKVPGT